MPKTNSVSLLSANLKAFPFIFLSIVVACVVSFALYEDSLTKFITPGLDGLPKNSKVNSQSIAMIFLIGELLFCFSSIMMLRAIGRHITWRNFRDFKINQLFSIDRRVCCWLWVNRLSWIIPLLILCVAALDFAHWWVIAAILGEVATTVMIGIAVSFGLALPRLNSVFTRLPQLFRQPIVLRAASQADVSALTALEREVWGDGAASIETLTSRLRNCPEGNLVAETRDGRLCGFVSFCRIDYERYAVENHCSWYDLTGNGTASTHDPDGPDLFGINLAVPYWAPKGTSTALMLATLKAGIRVGVRRGLLGARICGYHKRAGSMTADEYAWSKRGARPLDPELRFYSQLGLKSVRLVENYFVDPASLNWGMLLELRNPFYRPGKVSLLGRLVTTLSPLLHAIAIRTGRG
jgi:hypothetical protein